MDRLSSFRRERDRVDLEFAGPVLHGQESDAVAVQGVDVIEPDPTIQPEKDYFIIICRECKWVGTTILPTTDLTTVNLCIQKPIHRNIPNEY